MSKAYKGIFANIDGNAESAGGQSDFLNLSRPAASLNPLAISQLGASDPSGVVGNPGPEIGINAPADAVGNPGPEIGISAPTTDDVVPAGDSTSSVDAGDSLLGLGTWESVTHVTIVEGCSCACCQLMLSAKADGGDTGSKGVDPTAANFAGGIAGVVLPLGTNPDGSHFFSGNRNVDATLIGSKWGNLNLTFSFPTSGSNYNGTGLDSNGVNVYHIDLGPQQQAAARAAFALISAATGLTFTEITETDSVHANIRISQTADQDAPSAYGGFPSDFRGVAGDIWFGRTNQPYYDLAFKGTWGFSTMMHEIGHTMGLKHGHQDYTNLDLSAFFGTTPRFGSQSLTADRDGQAWSLMTYTPAPFTNSNFAGDKISQPQSYMQYDIAALQYMYGANFNTNSGDSVYTFSQTTGEMFINGVGQGAPTGNNIFLTIWDGGGNDTIDASNYANGVTIDLRPGEFSTVDQAQLVNSLTFQNLVSLAPGNFAMSLLYNNDGRSLIENATGGTGNDIFVGNTANNILDGGAGSDTVIFTNTTGVNVTLNDTNTDVIVTHDGETDTLRSIENIGGTSGNDTITGNSQDNVLTGGSGGADNLSGGDGNDRLIGGGFTVTTNFIVGSPPSQPDITKPQATNNGSIATAVNTAGAYDIDANPNITNATTIPHATINATATGSSLEYYRIDVTAAGAQAIFDIDGTGTLTDSIIELVDSAGNVLARNDTGPGDPGTTTGDDAYITFTFTTPGTYYIRVGRFVSGQTAAQPMLAGQTYLLNISLQGAAGSTTFTVNNTSSLVADGGEGNDYLQGTFADDTLTGGNGNDTASFATAYNGGGSGTTGVTVDLNVQGVAQNTVGAGSDTLTGIENLVGSQYNDTLTGDGNDNFIEGGLGTDTLVGGLGNDTASYAGATAGVTASLALQGAAQNTVNAGSDTLSGFENLLGSGFNDSLTGDANANTLTGGSGDDTLNPGANAGGTVDLLDGGLGSDTASFAGYAAGVTATLNGALDGAAIAGGAIATLRSIENLTGSSNADTLTGDGNANVIEGGLGNDILDGGLGVDTVAFSGATAVTVDLGLGTATGLGSDTILNFENVRTGSGADNVTGDGNDNTFFEGGGNDTYNGAGGTDTVDYSAATSTVTVNLTTTTAQATGTFGGTDTITNIENVVGAAAFANTLRGSTSANRLTGGSAADILEGRNGADVIIGGAGNDTLLGGTDSALDDGSADTLEGGLGSDFLGGGQGNDILRGGEGSDTLVGGVVNTINQFFTGVDGGDDVYDGGEGTDIAIMVYDTRAGVGASTVGIAFDIGNLAGDSAITFNGVSAGSLTSIERVTFRGTNVNDVVRGGGSLDSLTGGSGDDVLDGWIGNDLLSGGLGNDTLIGGEGLDTVTYVNSTAGVNVDLRIVGVAQNTGGEGIDTLSGIEYLTGSAFGDTLRGDDDFNLIIDTGVGAGATALSQTDSIFGYGGNDSIQVTRGTAAAAVATNINMDGGDGDDFIELRGGTLSAALAANTAGLSATGTGATPTYMALGTTSSDRNVDVVTVDGGAGNDRIVLSGVASATINAGSGADIVSISMLGATSVNNYQITLGAGADILQLGVGSNAANSTAAAVTARTSRVTDFQVGDAGDKFEMTNFLNFGLTGYTAASNAFASGHLRLVQSGSDLLVQTDRDGVGATNSFVTVFAISNGYTGGFTAFNFDGFIGNLTLTGIGALDETITGATGNDVLSGGDGNDVLIGLAGTDTLNGGNGDDSLTGGTGNDALNGGSGTDTANYSGPRSGYSFTYTTDPVTGRVTGFSSVTDTNAGNGDEGADTLTSIEKLTFSDQTIDLTQSVQLFDASNNLVGTFGTIQAAIDASSNGYTVRVAAGTYNENLNVNKDITIEGPNVGIAGNGARGAEATVNGLVSIVADGVTLNGLKITGAPLFGQDITAIFVNNDNATLTNLVLDGPNDGYGIQTTYNGGVTGLVLSNSLVTEWGAGTYFNPTTGFTATGNSFTGNGNDILGDGWVAGSFIDNNGFNDSVGSHIGYGTYLSVEDMRNFVGTNNTFTGTGSRAVGIFLYGDGTPGGQDVTGTEYADGFFASEFVAGSGTDSNFHGLGGNDSFTGGSGNDTIDGGADTDTANYSDVATIVENGGGGWTVTSAADGVDTLSNVEIVNDSNAGVVRLVGHGGYATIQDAINASSNGDTILVASGTWNEDLTIDKDVTIQAANNHGIAGTGARGAESVINGQIAVTAAGSGATLDGFKLVGPSTGSLEDPVVQIDGNNFSLINNVIDGTGSLAIMVGLVSGVDIGSNLLRGYDIGAYVSGGNTTGSIHNNRFQGDVGPGLTGMGNGVNSESSHVAIANNAFDEIYYGSLNIFPYGPDTVDLQSYITGNTITNSGVARPVQIMPTNLTHNILGTDFNEAFDGETAAGSYGVTGAFSFDGRGGDDKAWGGEEGDTLAGGTGIDELFGNGGNDNLSGGDQNDTLHGGAGDDTADGGNNNDIVDGEAGNDVLAGGAGIDTLNGGDDNDSLDGGSGSDTLNGGEGNDSLHGGAGNDALNGGNGTDTAVYDGHRGDYSITMITGAGGRIVGFTTVSDNEQGNGDEGSDSLNSVERLQFSNRTLDTTLAVQVFDQNNQLVGTYTTIQAGIDNSQDNYTIRVAAGVFDEDLVIDVGVRILGARTGNVNGLAASSGTGETTIIGHAKVTAEDNVTLTGLRFLNDSTTTGGGASDPTLQFLTGGGSTGHLVSNTIFWSTVAGGAAGDRAISAPAITSGTLTLTNNLISGSSQGLFGTASWDRGVWIDGGGVNLTASGNLVQWVRTGFSLDLAGGSIAFISNNTLRNLGTGFSIATSEDGFVPSGNAFENVGDDYNFRNLSEDINFDAGAAGGTLNPVGTANDLVVILGGSGNDTLTGTANADYIDANNRPGNLTVADTDTLNGGGGNDILFGRFGTDTLNGGTGDDSLDGGDGNDILNGNADNDMLAGGAGSDSLNGGTGDDALDGGSGIDTAVIGSGAVFTANGTNWTVTSSEGTDTLTNVEIVDSGPGPDILLVGSGGFATIQEAVNAAHDGDTILVAAGTYVEQVIVNNLDNLTIRAADGAVVTIQAPADLVETVRSSSDREVHAVLTAKDSLNLVISGIDIDGAGRGNTVDEGGGAGQANFYGVFYRNSSGSLFDVDIRGVRDPYPGGTAAGGQPLVSGVQRGVGLAVDNDALLAFAMIGGSITDFQKNATSFNRADLNIAGVTITGGGAQTGNAQNGIQVGNSTGSISGNTITGIGYAGPANAYSGAILAFGNTNLNITGNAITGANVDSTAAKVVGIYVFDNGAPSSGGSITGNSISHVDEGIDVTGDITPNGILIQNNDVTNIDGTNNAPVGVYFEPDPAFTTVHDVDGSAAADFLAGGAGNDILSGLAGDDVLTGNGGDDTLNGDAGSGDVAVYHGPRAGYSVIGVTDGGGRVTSFSSVDDTDAGNGDEGTDTLTGVERLQFGDVTLDLTDPVQLFDGGGQLVGTFDTIQAAVNAASSGYTISVAAGTYAEIVTVDEDVTIVGPNAGIAGAGARVGEAVVDGFYMHSAGATLNGLTILGGGMIAGNPAGIYVDVDNVTLTNLIVQGDGSAGTGVLTPYNGDVDGLVLSNSRIDDWTNGTYFNPTTQFTATGNSFDGNGVALTGDDWEDGTLISDNSFTNSSFGHVGYGVLDAVEDVGAFFGTGNSFDPSGGRIGIFAYGTDQDITGTQFGDYFADTVAGSDSAFHGEGGNDYIDSGSGNDSLEGGLGDDILVGGGGTDTAVFADPITLADLTFVADADPETAGDQPGWIVTTATEGTDRLVGIEIVDGNGANILLVGNGGFTTIQAAIDASSDGDTILVAPGTYDEDLDVHVGVTILGAKAGVAVAGRDAGGGTGETTVLGHAVVTATASVTLDGLRFLNDTTTTAPTVSILTGGGATGHVITDSIFWSTIAGGAGGVDDRAISISPIAVGLITITDNLISGSSQGQFGTASWGRGIWFDGGGVALVVTGNTIEWTRSGLNLDMSGSSTANISNNSFRGLGTGIAVGIDADGLTISGNNIERVNEEFSFRNLTTNVTFDAAAAIGTLTLVGDFNDPIVVLGGSGNDTFNGTAGVDVLDGNNSPSNPGAADTDVLNGLGGNDFLFGRGGNDTLDGGTGDDAMTGGTGNDLYFVDTVGDSVTEAAGEGTDEVRTALAAYTLAAALENLTGLGNVDQTLNGNSLDNVIDGGLGADAMTGGAGNDTYVVDNVGDSVTELAGEGIDEIRTNLATYSLAALVNLENLTGTNAAGQTLTGNGSANVITGAGGNDIIDGGTGADTMAGGAGNDLYFVDNAGDVVIELPGVGEGVDEVRTGIAVYSIVNTAVENLTATSNVNHDFRGNSGANVITGGTGNDLLRLYDGGDDTVLAGDGIDNIFFGAALTAADVVNGGGGVDTLVIQGNYAGGLVLSANVIQIENISILGGNNTNFGEPGTNRYDYVLTTNNANFAAGVQARINGSALLVNEDFTFDGSAETDASFVVYGGKGVDTLMGGFGNDIFIYAEERFAPGDTVNGGPGGYDGIFFRGNYTIDFNAPGYFGLMTGIENMTLTSITDERYARGGDPAGFDYNITLADNMLLAGVELTVSGALLQSYETMIVDGSLETDGTFRFFGGKAADTLKGGANNDLIHGNQGADLLTGGGGADTFRYDTTADSNSATRDQILDFTPGTDKIELTRVDADSLVAGNQNFTWIGSNAFTGSGAASAGQLRAFESGGIWFVEGDVNGDGVADLSIALTLQGPTPLSAADFFL